MGMGLKLKSAKKNDLMDEDDWPLSGEVPPTWVKRNRLWWRECGKKQDSEKVCNLNVRTHRLQRQSPPWLRLHAFIYMHHVCVCVFERMCACVFCYSEINWVHSKPAHDAWVRPQLSRGVCLLALSEETVTVNRLPLLALTHKLWSTTLRKAIRGNAHLAITLVLSMAIIFGTFSWMII